MHYEWFYYRKAQQMILLQKCITNDFYYRNGLQMIFTTEMHYKWFLLQKCITNDFTTEMDYKWFYYRNALQMILILNNQKNCIIKCVKILSI